MSDLVAVVLLALVVVVAVMALRGRLGSFSVRLPGAGAEATSRTTTKIRATGASVVENSTNNQGGDLDLEARDKSRISGTINNPPKP